MFSGELHVCQDVGDELVPVLWRVLLFLRVSIQSFLPAQHVAISSHTFPRLCHAHLCFHLARFSGSSFIILACRDCHHLVLLHLHTSGNRELHSFFSLHTHPTARQERNVSRYAVRNCFARLSETGCDTDQGKERPPQICVSLSWEQRHHRIDVTAYTVERKTSWPASAGTCPGGCKDFSHKGSNTHFARLTCKICGTAREADRHPQRQDPATCSHRRTDHKGATHTRERHRVDCGTYLDSVPREIFNALETTRSVSSNRDEELADRVTKDTTIRSDKSILRRE